MRGASIAGSLAFMAWARAVRRPIDSFAIFAAFAASLTIVVNGLFFQSGPHPASVSITPAPLSPALDVVSPKPTVSPPAATHSVEVTRTTQAVPAHRNDPIAQLIGQSSHVLAVQRALSEYGYGQIKQSGVLDSPTSQAIEQFEREHNLPVTGRISDGLLTELAGMIGHPL
ncbi:MAG TPA: peptidoglycan-binding domain-containing protein [Xanthobacteraceae bacterium]|nr:peptidoglycan-binding domain-containing protein [Xanthobacteraceae bacterium]